jgi:hypothetical protein
MRPLSLVLALSVSLLPLAAQPALAQYKVTKTQKVGGDGGFDYVTADSVNRKLYIARSGAAPVGRMTVFNLDTLAPAGEIATGNSHGAVIDVASNHGFASSKPLTMFDAKTGAIIKTIDVNGSPDGLYAEASSGRIYVLSHSAPNVTVLDAKDGSTLGTIDLGGAPEQAASDGKGHLYIDLEDKDSIAVVDTKALKLTTTYSLAGKGGGCAGLAIDIKNNILFSTCRKPQNMVIVNAATGAVITALPIGSGTDGATFNPATMEAFSSNGDGTLTVVKESSPTSFAVAQNVTTMPRAKTLALDTKTNNILLITAEFGAPPAAAPAAAGAAPARPARAVMIPGSFTIVVVGK